MVMVPSYCVASVADEAEPPDSACGASLAGELAVEPGPQAVQTPAIIARHNAMLRTLFFIKNSS